MQAARRVRIPVKPVWRAAALAALAVSILSAQTDAKRYLADVKYLSSPELAGRGTGTPGLEKAADYISAQLRSLKLQPAVQAGFGQRFPVTTNARLGSNNRFAWASGAEKHVLKLNADFRPLNFSSSAGMAGPLVFAGYGITAPEFNYDDYAGIDVKGRIVVVLRHEPQEFDDASVFAGKLYTDHAQFWSKAANAKRHGAAGVVLVADRANHRGEPDELEPFGRTVGPNDAGIPFVQVKAETLERWLEIAGKDLAAVQKAIDEGLRPQSFELPAAIRVEARTELRREVAQVRNIAAYVPGETKEYVIIGAHYDHLGLGEQFSMSPSDAGKVHPGADDNASGAAGVLELARRFAKMPKQKRGVLFLAFAGEELGVVGSRYYVDHPALPLQDAVAMINLDMIGRIRDEKVYVGGVASGTTFKPVVEEALARHGLKADVSGGMDVGSSDHVSFITKKIPSLFFFSGLHGDYHRPTDTWEKIDAGAAAKLLDAVGDIAGALCAAGERPQFVASAEPQGSPSAGGASRGAWFGSIPDFGEVPKGVKFAGVSAGSPAEAAGLKAGDVLIEFDGQAVGSLYDFTYALRAKKPGDVVKVKILRGGETVEAEVTLSRRR